MNHIYLDGELPGSKKRKKITEEAFSIQEQFLYRLQNQSPNKAHPSPFKYNILVLYVVKSDDINRDGGDFQKASKNEKKRPRNRTPAQEDRRRLLKVIASAFLNPCKLIYSSPIPSEPRNRLP